MDGGPVFLRERLELGNPSSCVAVCTLWTETGKVEVPREHFAVKGNLYSPRGINYMIRNLLASPGIRYLILCGDDRTGSGGDLAALFREGIDGANRIAGTSTALDSDITRDMIGTIRKDVELIDMRGREAEVGRAAAGLAMRGPSREPVILEPPGGSAEDFAGPGVSGLRFEGSGVPDTWLKLLDSILKFGELKKSEHGMMQKELLNAVAVIDGTEEGIPSWMPFGSKELQNYMKTFFGPAQGTGLSYTYGMRLFSYIEPCSGGRRPEDARKALDQIANSIKRLKEAPHTRRAVAFTWYVAEDSGSENPPCLTQITWSIRRGQLCQTAVFRSHDIFGGWPLNAYALRELQKRMASELSAGTGPLTIISNSAHVYENDFSQAGDMVRRMHSGKSLPFGEDRLGYFLISVEGGRITARHFLPDGKPGISFDGGDAEDLCKRILNEGLVSRMDHAAYLGRELERAEQALRSGGSYVQE